MARTVGINTDKDPAGDVVASWQADGDTIPYQVPDGVTLKIGDVVEYDSGLQIIGIVTGLTADYPASVTGTDNSPAAGPSPEVQLRMTGLARVKKGTAEEWSIGAYAEYGATAVGGGPGFAANATGAHMVVGGADATDAYGLVQINAVPRARTP